MDPHSLNNCEDDVGLVCEDLRGIVRHRQVPGEARGEDNQEQRQNLDGLQEYLTFFKEVMAYYQRNVDKSVFEIITAIISLLIFIVICLFVGYEWIPRMIMLFIVTVTGFRYCWRRWCGENINVINVNLE
ncbi:unnamed protein product [Orchesella dallaii]|uniref:Uncharacterized protein n=1 Tax=Orchesella dallaii TaxID=48710 RepID=A0ABP1RVD8_9HEXA